jgi:hypothetical protein
MITKEFLIGEIEHLKKELGSAEIFVLKAQTALNLFDILLKKFDETPEEEKECLPD